MLSHAGVADIGQLTHNGNDSHFPFGHAAVLPEQFYSAAHFHTNQPEAALMRAVLEEALTCFQYQFYIQRNKAQRLAQEAETWFFSDEENWPFSFVNICTVLQLDPDYIRCGLRKWKATWPLKIRQRKRRTIGTRRPLSLAA